MGWLLKRRKKDNKFRLWSTNSDSWLTGWVDAHEVKQYAAQTYIYEFKQRVIEMYYKFPHFWGKKDNGLQLIIDEEGEKRYKDWMDRVMLSFNDKTYYKLIDDTFEEIRKELDIEI